MSDAENMLLGRVNAMMGGVPLKKPEIDIPQAPETPQTQPMPQAQPAQMQQTAPQVEPQTTQQAQQPAKLSAHQKRFKQLYEAGKIDVNGVTKDGKMYRGGPESMKFRAQHGKAHILKNKELMAEFGAICLEENRKIARSLGYDVPEPEGANKVDPNYEKKFNENLGKKHGERVSDLEQEVTAAYDTMPTLYEMQKLQPMLKTGFGQAALDQIGRFSKVLGISPSAFGANDPAIAQQYEALINGKVMEELMKQKGVQSDSDAIRAFKMWPQIKNDPEANRAIIEFAVRRNQRIIDKNNFVIDQMRKGVGESEAMKLWREHEKRNLPPITFNYNLDEKVSSNTAQGQKESVAQSTPAPAQTPMSGETPNAKPKGSSWPDISDEDLNAEIAKLQAELGLGE